MAFEQNNELQLLEALAAEPETTQADLAARAGVAVGTVNWYLKRWSAKGLVIVKRIDRWRWRYLLTPKGMAEKAELTAKFLEASFTIYRRTREEARSLLQQVQAAGYDEVVIEGDGDVAEVCELTCLEMGVKVQTHEEKRALPRLTVEGLRLTVQLPNDHD